MKKTIWHGSKTCDFCKNEITDGRLYDAKTKFGCWATMCHKCYIKNGVGVGTGKGQRYELNKETNEFEKVEG